MGFVDSLTVALGDVEVAFAKIENIPSSYVALAIYLLIHGFFLDIIIIGLVPFCSPSAATTSRKGLFPW